MVLAERVMFPLPFVPTKGSTKNSSQPTHEARAEAARGLCRARRRETKS